ncbi:helix-turn-helix transcriptional regulator [Pseudonocardia sp. TRM90224]|uniref:helix-turn-helix transcriptional regulator n=1 Tax=Pseudonocardia sp. TRM90224 TaxID=2812678 RepID=UPI001E4BA04E|nr:WYL domain-containing protein [Pseudonocardia sp. TRM90224]
MADVSRRTLQLLSLLQTGRGWAGAELAERLATSPRTLRRDVERLRGLGYPVETRPGPGGHYRLVAGTAMPPLLLDDDEAVAVAVGLRMVADAGDETGDGALRKLEQVLPARLRRKVAAVHHTTETAGGGPSVPADLLALVGAAAQNHERMWFDYRSRDGASSARRVEPYRQVLSRRRWYLLAWDLDRAEWRTFRLDRMSAARTTGERFEPRELPAATAAEYLDAALKAPRHRAVITFLAPLEQVADRIVDRDGTLEPLDATRCRLTTWVDSFEWLAVTTAVAGIDFRVEEPAGFTGYCRELRDRLDRAAR